MQNIQRQHLFLSCTLYIHITEEYLYILVKNPVFTLKSIKEQRFKLKTKLARSTLESFGLDRKSVTPKALVHNL